MNWSRAFALIVCASLLVPFVAYLYMYATYPR